jgi:hypothetical protein
MSRQIISTLPFSSKTNLKLKEKKLNKITKERAKIQNMQIFD